MAPSVDVPRDSIETDTFELADKVYYLQYGKTSSLPIQFPFASILKVK